MTRRGLLRSAVAAAAATAVGACRPAPKPASGVERAIETYGAARLARGAWLVPRGRGDLPVVVLVHGGFWQPSYDRHLEDDVAGALADRGFAVWNIDYRSAADDWPATFVDTHSAVEHLRHSRYAGRLDLGRVAVVGHSAGGHLALWLASRGSLPAGAVGAGPVVHVALAVAQAPVADLVAAARTGVGGGAVEELMGGSPDDEPERYAVGSPRALLPVPDDVRLVLVHGTSDGNVPVGLSESYAVAARAAGTEVDLRLLPGVGHFEHLDPRSSAVAEVFRALADL